MPDECGAEQCLFCAFAHLACLHPQRLALLQPHKEKRQQEGHGAASKASDNEKQQEQKGRGVDGCATLKSVCRKKTRNDTRASEEEEPLPKFASSYQSTVHQIPHSFSNKHRMYDGDKAFTYSTLLALANALAERLRKLLTDSPNSASFKAPEDAFLIKVCILIGPSVEYVVAILAVLQCGFAFVPLEPSWPARRIATIVADSEPFILLTNPQANDAFRDFINNSFALSFLCFDVELLQQPYDPLVNPSVADCLCFCHTMGVRSYCYVLYTSGSLGEPKGVYGTEMGLLHRLRWMQKEYPFLEGDVAIFKTSVAFVDHLTELFGPLLGGSLVVVPPFEELFGNPLGLLPFCKAYNISRLTAVPSLLRAVIPTLSTYPNSRAFLSVKVLVLSGEVLPYDLLKLMQTFLPHTIILNLYGCTELSGDCLCFDCRLLEEAWDYFSVPIGKPLPECIVEIFSEHSENGDEGELWLGGVLVALGYHNDTASRGNKFTAIADPNAAHHDVRFFRTGDYVKRLKDGSLLFLGRKDRVVKVNGNKVSLDEVESSLGRHPLVAQCAISYQKGASSESIIVAHVVLNRHRYRSLYEVPDTFQELVGVTSTETSGIVSSLRNWLTERLPTAMLPGSFIFLGALPCLSSGKINYQALSALEVNRPGTTIVEVSEAEVSSFTSRIRTAFELVLKLDNISIYDNFFSLGGTSVSAAHVAHILAIDMRLLYTHSSVIELEPVLRALREEANGPLAANLDYSLPDMRAFKRAKKDQAPNASHSGVCFFLNEHNVSSESSNSRQAVEDDNWPFVHKDDAPQALFRGNVCMPMKTCLSMHNFFSDVPSVNGLFSLSILWKTQLKACVDASPVLMRYQSTWLVFIGSHAHNFVCMDAYNGNVVWERGVGGRVESTAAITSDVKHVVVGSYDGYLYVLDSERGTVKWKFQTKAEVKCQPTVDWRGFIWCGSHDHHLYALSVVEQRCVWEHDCKASIFGAAAHDFTRFLTYVATTAGTIMAFLTDCSEPKVTWIQECGAPIFGSLAVDALSGFLICTLVNGKVLAFTSSGSIVWEYITGGPVFAGATLTAALPSQVLVCSRDGWVYSLHLFSGERLWKCCLGEPITSSVYVDESLNLVNEEFSNDTISSHNFRLVCACGSNGQVHVMKVYAGSTTTKLSCSSHVQDFHTKKSASSKYIDEKFKCHVAGGGCELLAALKLPGDIFSSPVMLGGRIFVGCRDNNLYCLEILGLDPQAKGFSNSYRADIGCA